MEGLGVKGCGIGGGIWNDASYCAFSFNDLSLILILITVCNSIVVELIDWNLISRILPLVRDSVAARHLVSIRILVIDGIPKLGEVVGLNLGDKFRNLELFQDPIMANICFWGCHVIGNRIVLFALAIFPFCGIIVVIDDQIGIKAIFFRAWAWAGVRARIWIRAWIWILSAAASAIGTRAISNLIIARGWFRCHDWNHVDNHTEDDYQGHQSLFPFQIITSFLF